MFLNLLAFLLPLTLKAQPFSASLGSQLSPRTWQWKDDFSGYRSIGYFANWGIYNDDPYFVTNITASDLTHVLYAFANVDPNNGTVYLSDEYSDLQYAYPDDNTNTTGNDVFGNVYELYKVKKKQRNFKVSLSIGGWTYSPNFANITDASWRTTFVDSSVSLMQNLGMDGLDVDYEYVTNETAQATVALFKELREALTFAGDVSGSDFLLSFAAPCGSENWVDLDVGGMDQYLNFWNLMAYDFAGDWSIVANPNANLYPDKHANASGVSGQQCIDFYLSEGVNGRKVNLGMPMYASAFNGTKGMYTPFTDIGGGDDDTPGFYNDHSLPLEGETVFETPQLGAAYSYNKYAWNLPPGKNLTTSTSITGHLTSFDTPTVAVAKAEYVIKNQLGGIFYWSLDEDWSGLQKTAPTGPWEPFWQKPNPHWIKGAVKGGSWPRPGYPVGKFKRDAIGEWRKPDASDHWSPQNTDGINLNNGMSLVDTVALALNKYGGGLDQTQNTLSYPSSDYHNIRNGE
ncbi:chitinase, partial [Tremellales sp. Uapishka_1]